MSARALPLVLCVILCAAAWAKDPPAAALRGVTRRTGVRCSMRVEIRRLPIEPAAVPLFHEARRRAWPVEGSALGFVEGDAVAETTSDENGLFRLFGLTRGHYEVRAVADDGLRAFAPLTVRGRGGEYVLDLGVAPGPRSISGRARRADGRPFSGWLVITQDAEGRVAAPWLRGAEAVRTDEHGRFTVGGLVDSAVEIQAVVSDRGRIPCLRLPSPTEAPVEIVVDGTAARTDEDLASGCFVSGCVLELERGTPAAGACVHLAGAVDGASSRVCVADAAGRYEFQDVSGEPFCLFVSGGGWLDADPESVMRSRRLDVGNDLDVSLRAVRAEETATVRVLDQHGHPCAGVEVYGRQPHIPHAYAYRRVHEALAPVVTDAKGRCHIGPFVPNATISVTLAHPRFAVSVRDRLVVQPGAKLLARVRRVRGSTGRVELPDGVSPRRVQLTVQGLAQSAETPWRIRLRPDASFRLPAISEGHGRVRAAAWRDDEYLAGRIRVAPLASGKPEPVLALTPAQPKTAWRFRVLDPNGHPVHGGWGVCRMRAHRHPGHEVARIDEGYADVECYTPGARMDSAHFYAFWDRSGRRLTHRSLTLGAPSAGFRTVRLVEGRALRVRVHDTAGEPIPDAEVQASLETDPSSPGARAVTDSKGTARLVGLGPGTVRVIVETPRHFLEAAPVEIAADATDATVVLVPYVAARLRVTRPDGSPVEGARVCASSATSGPTAFTRHGALRLVTDGSGRCQLPPLRPGVRIDLRIEPIGEDLLPFTARWWQPADQMIVLIAADSLRGRVVDGRGQPIAEATVWIRPRPGSSPIRQWGTRWWRDGDGFVLGAIADTEGVFRIERLVRGKVELRAVTTTPDGQEHESDILVVETSAPDLRIRIPAAP